MAKGPLVREFSDRLTDEEKAEVERRTAELRTKHLAFDQWFASYLDKDQATVRRLLDDKSANQFLMVWSIFESDCFEGYIRLDDISDYSKRVTSRNPALALELASTAKYFHARYQDKQLYKNLMHKQKLEPMSQILLKNFDTLEADEIVFLLVVVVYRYRNNIFHGNKGVSSWLQFTEQINKCRLIMQKLIDTSDKQTLRKVVSE